MTLCWDNTLTTMCKEKLKKSKKIFGHLCLALAELNHVFSLPAFIYLSLKMVSSAFYLYIVIYGLISDNEFLRKMVSAATVFCLLGFGFIITVCCAAELPMNQVSGFKRNRTTLI